VLHDGMPGYGVVELRPGDRTFVAECWPRAADTGQYEGWPKTLHRTDMDGRAATAWLPPMFVEGAAEPVVRVFAPDGSLWTAFRAREPRVQVGVDGPGRYRVEVGDGDGDYTGFEVDAVESRADEPLLRVRVGG
jgi:hypothetical protein